MKKILKNKPVLLVGSILLTVALGNFWINFRCSKAYTQLLADKDIVDVFSSGDRSKINTIAARHGLEYQRSVDGKIKFSSEPWLPKPKVVSYQRSFAEGVILPSAIESLNSLQYYKIFRGVSVYVMFPICTANCQAEMYIVYKKAAL